MFETIMHTAVVLTGLVLLLALWSALRRWGALAEIRTLIGEALLLSRRGPGAERDR